MHFDRKSSCAFLGSCVVLSFVATSSHERATTQKEKGKAMSKQEKKQEPIRYATVRYIGGDTADIYFSQRSDVGIPHTRLEFGGRGFFAVRDSPFLSSWLGKSKQDVKDALEPLIEFGVKVTYHRPL